MVARGASIPPPVEGWDAVSPISAMPPTRAVELVNWFPQPSWVELRRGSILHSELGTGEPVETVMSYQGLASDKMFAVSDGTIFDVTASGTGVSDVTGLSNSRFQFINFGTTGGNFLYAVNGVDDPQYYDGANWAVATITGTGSIIGVTAHKGRLWFTPDQSSDAFYLAVDSIQGAATALPLGAEFTMGGYLMAIGTWSLDAGNGPDDYIVFLSSRGQAAVYRGSDPSDASDWGLVGVFNIGAPIGRRCLTKVGADIAVICIDGVVPLSNAMIYERAAVQKVALTQRIQRVMNQSARTYGENFGWQLISYPRGTRAILNVPITEGGLQHQYVMNTLSGAWCRFTGMNANCWELLNNRLFYGGNDGNVYEADVGGADAEGAINADMRTAFNYFGVRGKQKRWMMCRPLITTDSQVQPGIAFNVDFKEDAPISIPSSPAFDRALWDIALWDDADWAGQITTQVSWTSVAGLGYCASIRMAVDIPQAVGTTSEVILQVNGFDITFETGAFV